LETVIRIARAIERMQKALRAVLLMGQPASAIPKQALRYYAVLSRDIRNRPTTELSQDLQELDRRIKADLLDIVALAHSGDRDFATGGNVASDEELDRINRRLEEFRRLSQTAVCLRILLRERGVTTTPMALPVPEQAIQRQIQALDTKEREYKTRLRENVAALKAELETMIERGGFPDAVLHELTAARDGLQANLEHIDAGRDLEALPFTMETTDAAPGAPTEAPPANPTARAPQPKPAAPQPPRGFFRRLWAWLNSPWSVRWSDVSDRNRRKQ
jgi:hypothetical protein